MKKWNVFFTLSFLFLITYRCPAQSFQWAVDYTGEIPSANNEAYAIALDNSGNVYVTGMSDPDNICTINTSIATVGYDASGQSIFFKRYTGCGDILDANAGKSITAATIDDITYVYVAGRKYNDVNGTVDYVTLKYRVSDGILLWQPTYHGSGNGYDQAVDIAVDIYGNAYVTGQSWNGSNSDYVTIKYDFDGNLQWKATYSGGTYSGGYGNDIPSSIAYAGGYVYVTGSSDGNGTGADFATICYNYSTGAEVWATRYTSGGSNEDRANDIAADIIFHGVYVTGVSGGNFTTIRYDNLTGSQKWNNPSYTGEGKSIGLYRVPCAGGDINCYTIEAFATGSTGSDGITIGYAEDNGSVLTGWPTTYSSTSFVSLGIDGYENIYVTGGYDNNYLTVMYNKDGGAFQWNRLYRHARDPVYGDPTNQTPSGLRVDYYGNVFVTGAVEFGGTSPTAVYYTTIKYSP